MKIALDAMGGDKAPSETVKGGVEASRRIGTDVDVLLVGQPSVIEREMSGLGGRSGRVSIVEAQEAVTMDEPPTVALRQKPQSSIAVGLQLVKRGEAAAFVSAGNTGAVVAYALTILGMQEGVDRPAIAALFHTLKGMTMLLDSGANADCKPSYLQQFAQMGSLYMEQAMGVQRPRVGLLNIGEEESKGNKLMIETHQLLKAAPLNFVGNLEGKDVFNGAADVVVTDGFTGNVALKVAEGVSEALLLTVRQELGRNIFTKLVGALARPSFRRVAGQWDYRQFGGAPLLGVQGTVIIAHGRSDALAIRNAIAQAQRAVTGGWVAQH